MALEGVSEVPSPYQMSPTLTLPRSTRGGEKSWEFVVMLWLLLLPQVVLADWQWITSTDTQRWMPQAPVIPMNAAVPRVSAGGVSVGGISATQPDLEGDRVPAGGAADDCD